MGEIKKVPDKGMEAGLSSAEQKDNLVLVDSEHPELVYNISGTTKDYQAILQLEKEGDIPDFIRLQGVLILKLEAVKERGKNPGETTLILLHAVKLGLETARKNGIAFHWLFNPIDPEYKMAEWERRHLDSGEIKKDVAAADISEELRRVGDRIAELAAKTNIKIEVSSVDDPQEFSDQMAERLKQVENEIKKSTT